MQSVQSTANVCLRETTGGQRAACVSLCCIIVFATEALAQVGTPPPFFCGKTYVFSKAVPNGNFLADQAGAIRIDTMHFLNLIEFNNQCPNPPQTVSMSAVLNCTPGPSTGPELFGPFALNEGFTEIPIDVAVPAGPVRVCDVIVTATVSFADGSQIAQTADQIFSVVEEAFGNPVPRLEIELVGDDIVRTHPGDGGAYTYRISNNDPFESFGGTVSIDMRNVSGTPAVVSGQDDTAIGSFAVAEGNFSIAFSEDVPAGNCVQFLDFPNHVMPQSISKAISIGPNDFIDTQFKGRTWFMSPNGHTCESTAIVDGFFDGGDPATAAAGVTLAVDHSQTRTFTCPTDTGRAATALFDGVAGGPAIGISADSTQAGDHPFQVNFGLDLANMDMLIDGTPIGGGTPNFSGPTQVDGQHGRLVAEFSFITPLASPGAIITLITPIIVERDNLAASDIVTEIRGMDLVGDVPVGFDDIAPVLQGRVDVSGIVDPEYDSILDIMHQMSAVGVEQGTFNQVAMTNLDVEVELVAADEYVITSTWTATTPGATPLIGFDVSNDFRGFARKGDDDGDAIPNTLDSCQYVFNPDQELSACSGNVSLDQVDFIARDGTALLLDSDYGVFDVALPNPGDAVLFVNAEINGVWQIQNMPVTGIDFVVDVATQDYRTTFEIGPAGVNATGTTQQVRLMAGTMRRQFGFPTDVLGESTTVGQTERRQGADESGPESPPPPAGGGGPFPKPTGGPHVLETATRPGFEMVDLDSADDENACTPGAIASSFVWLNRKYCLGEPDPPGVLDTILADLKPRLRTFDSGTKYKNMVRGKLAYIRHHRLPLTVEAQGRQSVIPDNPFNPDDLFKQMKLGQDVELSMRFGGESLSDNGHTAAVVEMTKEGDLYTLTIHDDDVQDRPGGNDKPIKGWLALEGGFWRLKRAGDEKRIVGWMAESPTKAAINRAVCEKADAVRLFIEGLAGSATEAESDEIIRKASHLDFLTRRLFENINCDPLSTQEQGDKALNAAVAVSELEDLAQEVKEDINDPVGQAEKLAATRDKSAEIKDFSVELRGLYPPDADFDDDPDDEDNAPNDANPDQADCNMDGIGDVLQLAGNDCNLNGIPDDCEIGDLDGDLDSDLQDFQLFQRCFGATVVVGGPCSEADLNCDGVVDAFDLAILALNIKGPL